MRHILVKKQQLADKLYTELKDGANFATLAKKYSQDPGSKAQGGKLTITKGQTVPQFDSTAFALKTLALSKPVHTQFGWHIIQALKDTVPSKETPYPQVQNTIKSQLLSTKRNAVLSDWYTNVRNEFASKIRYATGYAPASTTATPTTGSSLADALVELQQLTERLRRDCPWDREQTEKTIVPHTVEEAYEVADAAIAGDDAKLLDELGDLLFQVFFLSLLLQEKDTGDMEAVARGDHAKLVRRHPHVFGEVEAGRPSGCGRTGSG